MGKQTKKNDVKKKKPKKDKRTPEDVEADRLREEAEAEQLAVLAEKARQVGDAAIEEALAELAEEEQAKKQAALMEKLLTKGKIMVTETMKAAVDGEVGNVRAYDPKDGRYIVQMPSGQLARVGPQMVTSYRPPPLAPVETAPKSKYDWGIRRPP